MNVAESIVEEKLDFGFVDFFALAGEEMGVVDIEGVENTVGGDVEDVVVFEVGFEGVEGELGVEVAIAGEDAFWGLGCFDDRIHFGFYIVEGSSILELGGSEGEDVGGGGWRRTGGGACGGGDGGDGLATGGEVLFAVVEGCDRDVAGGAIENEDEVLDVGMIDFGFEGFDQPVVEFLAGGLEFTQVATGRHKLVTELIDGGKEVFAFEGVAIDRSEDDGRIFSGFGFEGDEELDFGFGDDGINQEGAGLGVNDRSACVVQFGGVKFAEIDRLIFEGGAETIEHFTNVGVNAIALVLELGEFGALGFGAAGEFLGEGGSGAVGLEKFVEGFLFGGSEADALAGEFCITGVGANFFKFEQFKNSLGFGDTTLFNEEIG